MEDDIDIYEDLPSFEARDCEKYKEEIRELSQKCNDFERENAELKLKVEELSKSNQTLSNNLSSLLKTAKAEISRKDRMIAELRQQHDNMAFRRDGHGKPKKPKPQEKYPRHNNYNNYDASGGQESLPVASQPISHQESEDEVEETEQKYEPEKIACTVFGERLRKKILLEQEAERIQKEEIRLMKLESQASAVQIKTEAIAESKTTNEVVKVELQEVVKVSSEETPPSVKSSAHSLTDVSLPSHEEEEDDRNLSERREVVSKFVGSRIDRDAAHPESKRRRTEDDRYHSDDSRHYNGNVKRESRFESKDNFRASEDVAKRLGHRRGSNNRDEFPRSRCGDRGKSNYRSRSRSPDRRHVEKRADRHRTDKYREYMDKNEKRPRSGESKDYSGKLRKDALRIKVEHRAEPMIAGRYDYGDYKSSKLDRDENKKSRSRSGGRIDCNTVDDRRTRLGKSFDRLANASNSDESSRERKGVNTRSNDTKHKVADRKDLETKLERTSRSRSKNEKGNDKAESSAQLPGPENDVTNKQIDVSTRLTDGLLALPESKATRDRIKKECNGSKRKSNDESTAAKDRDRDSGLKSQTATSSSCEKEATNKKLVSPTELPKSSEKELTNDNLIFPTQLSDSVASVAKSDETPETNKQPELDAEEITKQSNDASAKSQNLEPMNLEEKDNDSEPKTQTRSNIRSEKEIKNEKLASCVSGTENLSSKLESTELSIIKKCQKNESIETTTPTLPNKSSQIEPANKLISSALENDTELPSTPTESQPPSDAGSRSFREEKIENIEKFIQNYQDDENLCCRIAGVDAEESNREDKLCNSTSSILDALSTDLEVVDSTGNSEDDGNISVNEQLLLETLSTPVKKKNPPLPPLPPPDETQQPPLPPVPPPDEKDRPPLPPIPYPEEIKQQSLPPLPPSAEKDQPPLPPASPVEKDQSPLPPSASTPKKPELPLPPAPNPETQDEPPLSSPEGKQEPPLPPSDCDNEISPPVASLDTKPLEQPKEESSNDKKSSSPSDEPQQPDGDEHQPSPLSLDDKKENSPAFLSSDDKKPSTLPATDEKKPSALPATDEKTDSTLSSPVKEVQMESSLSKLPDSGETDGQSLSVLPVLDKKMDESSSQVPAASEKNEKVDTVSSQDPSPSKKNCRKNEKVDAVSSQVSVPSEKNEKVDAASSQVPVPSKKHEKVDAASSQVSDSNKKNEKVDASSSQVSDANEKNEKVDAASSQVSDSSEKNEKVDAASLQVPSPGKKSTKPSSQEKTSEKKAESPETQETSSAKSEPEKPRTEKATPKQITRRHKIPCIPIVSRYTRQRRDMILADSEATRCIVKSDSSSNTEMNNNAKTQTKFSHVFTKEAKVILKQVESHKFEDARKAKVRSTPASTKPDSEKSEKIIEAAKNAVPENESKIESKTSTEISSELEAKVSSEEIVAATPNVDTNLPTQPGKNESTPQEVEPEERAASPRMRKRSALKTIATPDISDDGPGAPTNRKRTLPKEKENQSNQPEKRCKIMVVARRRRPVHLEDSSTAITLVSSAQDTKPDGSPKMTPKNSSISSEKPEVVAQSPGSVSKGRTRRSADKRN